MQTTQQRLSLLLVVHRFLTRLACADCWSFQTIRSLPTVLLVTLRATEEVIYVPHDLGFRGSTSSARCKAGRGSPADTGSPLPGDTRWYGGDTGRSFTHNTSQNTLTKEIYQILSTVLSSCVLYVRGVLFLYDQHFTKTTFTCLYLRL